MSHPYRPSHARFAAHACLALVALSGCAHESASPPPIAATQPQAAAQPESAPLPPLSGAPGTDPLDWRTLEAPLLTDHIQLTSRDQFVKAGEAYFNPDAIWIIFQAVPVPPEGMEPDPFYSMYVAKLTRDPAGGIPGIEGNAQGAITGIEEPIQISPPGSANTCGWFHPANDGRVIFGSTLVRPGQPDQPGFKVGTNKYAWSFPQEMDVVMRTISVNPDPIQAQSSHFLESALEKKRAEFAELDRRVEALRRNPPRDPEAQAVMDKFNQAKRTELLQQIEVVERMTHGDRAREPGAAPDGPTPLFSRPDYDAECSYSPDSRFVLYSHVEKRNPDGTADADIWIYDTQTTLHHPIVQAPGYDGGPFFSPDGRFITYRSDRRGDNLLQLFVGKLRYDTGGVPVGLDWEWALTGNQHVNWCPFWHPSGKFLVYATSEVGHFNYEVFAINVESVVEGGHMPPPVEVPRRITFANGADVLPVFSADGQWMMWTAQRGPMADGETKPSSQIWAARVNEQRMTPAHLFAAPHSP